MTADRGILRREAACALLAAGALALAGSAALASAYGLGGGVVARAGALYLAGALLVWRALPGGHPHARFGAANGVTLLRLAACAVLAAMVGVHLPWSEAAALRPVDASAPSAAISAALAPAAAFSLAWTLAALAAASALLDALDGPLARRGALASEFGARFDMETDAALTLVLCALLLQFDRAGAWILASGALRYVFVAAAALWPWLGAPLAPSLRRKTVCALQIGTLVVCLAPLLPRSAASTAAAASLMMLAWSFAVDVRALARRRHLPVEHTA